MWNQFVSDLVQQEVESARQMSVLVAQGQDAVFLESHIATKGPSLERWK